MKQLAASGRCAIALVGLCCVFPGCRSTGAESEVRAGSGGIVDHGAGTGSVAGGTAAGSGGSSKALQPKVFEPVTTIHGRMDVEITRGRVTALKAVRIDGDYRGKTTLSGDLLIVALAYGTPRWVQTVADPRTVHDRVQDDAIGVLSEQFPGEFMATMNALSNSDFEFYTTSPTTPLDTKVAVDNVAALKLGATLVGTVHGTDLLQFLYP